MQLCSSFAAMQEENGWDWRHLGAVKSTLGPSQPTAPHISAASSQLKKHAPNRLKDNLH
jgi:hypothetical protein